MTWEYDGLRDCQVFKPNICDICRTKDNLIQFGDRVYRCTECVENYRNDKTWNYSKAWKARYAAGYKKHTKSENPNKCSYCGSGNVLTDIFSKPHPNPIHTFRGRFECAYCKYDREVVTPRHEREMAKPKTPLPKSYYAHTFTGGAGSGIDPDKVLKRIADEREQRRKDFERRVANYRATRRVQGTDRGTEGES